MSKLTPERACAFACQKEHIQQDKYIRDFLRDAPMLKKLTRSQKSFVYTLVLGVCAYTDVLDELIKKYITHQKKIKTDVKIILRCALYELVYMDSEAYFVIDQANELAKKQCAYAKGFINAVLRNFVRSDFEDYKRIVKTQKQTTNYTLDELHIISGLPVWFIKQLTCQYTQAELVDMCRANLYPAPFWVAAAHEFSADKQFIKENLPITYEVSDSVQLDFSKNDMYPSDLAAQYIAYFVSQIPADAILEIGQGRATKSLLIEENRLATGYAPAKIVGIDPSKKRLEQGRKRYVKKFAHDITSICADATELAKNDLQKTIAQAFLQLGQNNKVQVVFCDAPCSGTGTFRRHPELVGRLHEDLFSLDTKISCVNIQQKLLLASASYLEQGGYLVYATCSVMSQENTAIIEHFLESDMGKAFEVIDVYNNPFGAISPEKVGNLHLVQAEVQGKKCFQSLPQKDKADGHFMCVLKHIR